MVVTLLLALLLASPTVARAAQTAEGTTTVPRFEPAPCPKLPGAEEVAKASCGYLVVLEDRNRPTGRTIRLMVAKYPARSTEKKADPVVYLAGGPGDIAPLDVNGLIAADFIRDRDIYVVSQRGTMFSEPALTCASIDNFARELLGLRFYSEATKRTHLAATEACHHELAATGADLSVYNSTESAADFADLRKVLGYETWNVYGMSYGSYLAQTLMRDHPEGIRSVVLDSVLPTTYTAPANWWNTRAGFDNLFQACAAEPACLAAHPHLEDTFTGLVNKFEAEPLTATVRDPATGEDVKVLIDGGALVDWLRNQNYSLPTLQAAPNRIDGLATGRPEALEAIALDRVSRAPPPGPDVPALGYGLALGVSCREDYPFATPEDLAAAGREAFPDYPTLGDTRGCRRLGIFQRRLPRGLEGPRRPGCHAPASREQHPDAPHLWQLRYADVPRRGEGRGGKTVQCNYHQHPGHRARRLALVALRPVRDRIVPRRSRRPRHILRRRAETA
jgi:pimeloyl-ACP methyl ester carboxylesterase